MRFTESPPIDKALHHMLGEQAATTLKLVRKDIAAEAERVREGGTDYLEGYADGLARAREMLDAMIAGLDLAEVTQRGEDQ